MAATTRWAGRSRTALSVAVPSDKSSVSGMSPSAVERSALRPFLGVGLAVDRVMSLVMSRVSEQQLS